MKKPFLIIVFFIFSIPFCSAYTEDTELNMCLKNAGGSYSGMYDCTAKRKDYFKKENELLLKELQTKLSESSYKKIINNQRLLSLYVQSLNNGELKILNDTHGLMYQTFGEETLLMVYETNFQILSIINNNKYNRDKSIKKVDLSANKHYLNELKNYLTSTQYNTVVKSQKIWETYKTDMEKSILPMIPTEQQKQYIIQILLEDRINALSNVNTIFSSFHVFDTI